MCCMQCSHGSSLVKLHVRYEPVPTVSGHCCFAAAAAAAAADGHVAGVAVWLAQYHILREKGTEPPGSGKYNKFYEEGVYKCTGCGQPLYKCVAQTPAQRCLCHSSGLIAQRVQ
jgi:hypothetical protein